MKRIQHTLYLAIILILGTLGCENEPLLYQGEEDNTSGIYFYSVATFTPDGTPLSYRDSVIYSFQNDGLNITERIVNLPVRTLGNISNQDRTFKVKVDGGTAKEGVDYEKLADEYIIPAGKATGQVPIKLIRTTALQQKALTIDVRLVENENFKFLLPVFLNIGNNKEMDATRFRVNFSEIITEFSYYTSFGTSYFGDWSVKKFKILNDLMGWTTNDWRVAGGKNAAVALGKFAFAATRFKIYLEEQLNAKKPIYEDDGKTLMQLGPAYMVDYTGL